MDRVVCKHCGEEHEAQYVPAVAVVTETLSVTAYGTASLYIHDGRLSYDDWYETDDQETNDTLDWQIEEIDVYSCNNCGSEHRDANELFVVLAAECVCDMDSGAMVVDAECPLHGTTESPKDNGGELPADEVVLPEDPDMRLKAPGDALLKDEEFVWTGETRKAKAGEFFEGKQDGSSTGTVRVWRAGAWASRDERRIFVKRKKGRKSELSEMVPAEVSDPNQPADDPELGFVDELDEDVNFIVRDL